MICNKCGAQIPNNSEFCSRCGNTFLHQPEQPRYSMYEEPKMYEAPKKSKKPWIIGIIAGFVVLVGIIIALSFVIINKNDESAPTQSESVADKISGTWYEIGVIYDYGETNEETELYASDEYKIWNFNDDGTYSNQWDEYGPYSVYAELLEYEYEYEGEKYLDAYRLVWEDEKLILVSTYFLGDSGRYGLILSRTQP